MSRIVGLSAFHADASAAALADGRLVAGVEEERFRRIKHWAGFPELAIRYCLEELGGEADAFAVARKPRAYLLRKAALALSHPRSLPRALGRVRNLRQVAGVGERLAPLLASGNGGPPTSPNGGSPVQFSPSDGSTPRPSRDDSPAPRVPSNGGGGSPRLAQDGGAGPPRLSSNGGAGAPPLYAVEHHLAHAASAFFCSPFEEAMCLTVDGFGDFVSTLLGVGRGSSLDVLQRVHFPHSLGLFYTAVTQFLGFVHFGDEYKVMGLAAYGEPRFADRLARLVPALPDGTFRLDLRYFRHLSEGVDMTWEDGAPELGRVYTPALEALLGPARRPDDEIGQRHRDLAASLQAVYEERFFALVRALGKRTGLRRLALAGGCALNSLANGKLFERTDVTDVYIQAAAGDAGTALGAALYAHHVLLGGPRGWVMEHAYWGPEHGEPAIRAALAARLPGSGGRDGAWDGIRVETFADTARLAEETAAAIARGEVVGWYQGRSEWGPRALGNRSIVADPRRGDMKDLLNRKIKRRESFRPFAPSVLEERVGDWFTVGYPDPFMLKVYPIRPEKRPLIPAVTHVDGTGRLQTVSRRANPRYWELIAAFERQTGVPMVLNTSFNENEPIVNTPEEALDCFLRTRMDRLVLGDVVLARS